MNGMREANKLLALFGGQTKLQYAGIPLCQQVDHVLATLVASTAVSGGRQRQLVPSEALQVLSYDRRRVCCTNENCTYNLVSLTHVHQCIVLVPQSRENCWSLVALSVEGQGSSPCIQRDVDACSLRLCFCSSMSFSFANI
jgi:hypothetical protein